MLSPLLTPDPRRRVVPLGTAHLTPGVALPPGMTPQGLTPTLAPQGVLPQPGAVQQPPVLPTPTAPARDEKRERLMRMIGLGSTIAGLIAGPSSAVGQAAMGAQRGAVQGLTDAESDYEREMRQHNTTLGAIQQEQMRRDYDAYRFDRDDERYNQRTASERAYDERTAQRERLWDERGDERDAIRKRGALDYEAGAERERDERLHGYDMREIRERNAGSVEAARIRRAGVPAGATAGGGYASDELRTFWQNVVTTGTVDDVDRLGDPVRRPARPSEMAQARAQLSKLPPPAVPPRNDGPPTPAAKAEYYRRAAANLGLGREGIIDMMLRDTSLTDAEIDAIRAELGL